MKIEKSATWRHEGDNADVTAYHRQMPTVRIKKLIQTFLSTSRLSLLVLYGANGSKWPMIGYRSIAKSEGIVMII